MVRDILAVHKPAPVSPGLKVRIREEFPEIKGEEV
jgi:trimethylamine--corrinoid protein Co-methyltransferase